MPKLLERKVAVVTGGGRGIGRAICIRFAREGAKVAVVARTEEDIAAVALEINESGGKAISVQADVANEDDVRRMVKATVLKLGPVDILVNNAAKMILSPIENTSLEDWEELHAINLRGPFLCAREVLPSMKARRTGRIINIGSLAGRRGYPEQGAYCASKHGLVGLSKVLALETQDFDIRVHVVAPGGVLTELSAPLRESRGGVKLEEWMTAEEVAEACVYVCTQSGAAVSDELVLRRYKSEPWR